MADITTYPYGDTLDGTAGDDRIETLYHNNLPHRYIYGLDGNDTIIVGSWSFSRDHPIYWDLPFKEQGDRIDGGSGDDSIFGHEGGNNIYGGSGSDVINGGTPDPDPIFGLDDLDDVIYGGSGNDTVRGQGGHDRIYGDSGEDLVDGGAGRDSVEGGAGNDSVVGGTAGDRLSGGAGRDQMTGGSGRDVFIFRAASDSGTKSTTRDEITDFSRGKDDIDLSGMDANTTRAGNQTFKFVDGRAFNDTAGELRFANGVVSGDVDGDGASDFKIAVDGLNSMSAGDFIL